MKRLRDWREADEDRRLAPYAQRVALSAGRAYPEPAHPFRTAYQRDRSRVIHSRAWRRLEYKTQVFLNGTGDHLRTRLTHSIEVASISRSLAAALGANEDLAEVIALAHDLGHAPFGHSGEEALDAAMREHGGFEHNRQSLRVVEKIEVRNPAYPGLNLSYEVLEGLRKHDRGYARPAFGECGAETFPHPSLEAQIANLADEIAYYAHDLDDGLEHGLIEMAQLEGIDVWRECAAAAEPLCAGLAGRERWNFVIRELIDSAVDRVVDATGATLAEIGARCADDVRRAPRPAVGYGADLARKMRQLRKFLYANLYYHPEVAAPNQRGCEMVQAVFQAYVENPAMLGRTTSRRIEADGLHRTVCDYIAGMTDRFLMDEFARLVAGG
ncbi:MAG: deoxyguanosinetriphosphate triphosphohydrolase [Verrucomicrobiales bacterium]